MLCGAEPGSDEVVRSSLVEDSENSNGGILESEIDGIGESSSKRPAKVQINLVVGPGPIFNSLHRAIDLQHELDSQADPLRFIPESSFFDIKNSCRLDLKFSQSP